MLATVKGYYDGNRIVIDEYVKLAIGQQVMVTILEYEEQPEKKIDLKNYKGRGPKLMDIDAQEYISKLRSNDRF